MQNTEENKIYMKDLVDLHNSLKKPIINEKKEQVYLDSKYRYCRERNIRMLLKILKPLSQKFIIDPKYAEYSKKSNELLQKTSNGEKGKKLKFDKKVFDKEKAKLDEEYKNAIKAQNKLQEDYLKKLNEEIKIDLHLVSHEVVPKELEQLDYEKQYIMFK